ncbi:MAG: hypothetical protein RLY71_454 [Pseudomonadota bacterium]|jgi:hypothetical protein
MSRTVTLIDGTEVSDDSNAWRLECEARRVARLSTTAQRHEYIDVVSHIRGAAVAAELRDLATIRIKEVLRRGDAS